MKQMITCFAALLLAGCAVAHDPSAFSGTRASSPGPFHQPLSLTGTEPFWGGEITGRYLFIERPDQPDLRLPPAKPRIRDGGAVWTSHLPDGQQMIIIVTTKDCSDGMSSRIYPFTAQLTIGHEVWRGCAALTEAWNRAGESGRVE